LKSRAMKSPSTGAGKGEPAGCAPAGPAGPMVSTAVTAAMKSLMPALLDSGLISHMTSICRRFPLVAVIVLLGATTAVRTQSPDGKTIAFVAKRGDNEFAQIYLLPVDGGEARQLTAHASAVSEISWTPEGAALIFKAADPKTADDKARERVKDDVYAYDENYKQTHLWKVTVESKAETRITDGDFSVTSYELSEDGKKIVYLRAPTPLLGSGDESRV